MIYHRLFFWRLLLSSSLFLAVIPSVLAQTNVPLEEVAQHDSSTDCWSVLYGIVYDLTEYGPLHTRPSPSRSVWLLCGTDGTSLYDNFHGNNRQWLDEFDTIVRIGIFGELVASPPTPNPTPAPSPKPIPAPTIAPTTAPIQDTGSPAGPTPTDEVTSAPSVSEPSADPTLSPSASNPVTSESPTGQTNKPVTSEPTTAPTSNSQNMISFAELAEHDTAEDCWVVYYENVYNMTNYAKEHPVGPAVITMSCGGNGTEAYAEVHPESWLSLVKDVIVGKLDPDSEPVEVPAPAPLESTFISLEELIEHDTAEDCWVDYYENVYDMTDYAKEHPVGPAVITMSCGGNGTEVYAEVHPESWLSLVKDDIVGKLDPDADTVPATAPPEAVLISRVELALHNTPDDCWVVYNYDTVYNMTRYDHPSPPGLSVVTRTCGEDASQAYERVHQKDFLALVRNLKIGVYSSSVAAIPTTLSLAVSVAAVMALLGI